MNHQNLTETVTSTKRIYDGKIINLRVDAVLLPDGKTSTREIVEHHGAVAIVPLLKDSTVILVRQYRRAACQALLEIPAGSMEPSEDPDATARRELVEEIQYSAGTMIKLFQSFVAPGYSTELIHTFLARDLTPQVGKGDEDEFLELVTLPLEESYLSDRDEPDLRNSKMIAGLLYVERLLQKEAM